MTRRETEDQLLTLIRESFPDIAYSGPITPADQRTEEEFDECRELYGALHGRPWSEIPTSVIRRNDYGLTLLTEHAFASYLPAWLTAGVLDQQIGEAVVYSFVPDVGRHVQSMDTRLQRLSHVQRAALLAFIEHRIQLEHSRTGKKDTEEALKYVSAVPQKSLGER